MSHKIPITIIVISVLFLTSYILDDYIQRNQDKNLMTHLYFDYIVFSTI